MYTATTTQILHKEHDTKGNKEQEEEDVIHNIFKVNINGTLNVVLPALKQAKMRHGRKKHIAIVASGAGYHGRFMGPYGITKTFLIEFYRVLNYIINFSLEKEIKQRYANSEQIAIHIINPAGVFDTKMGSAIPNLEKVPGSTNAVDAAQRIMSGLRKNEQIIDLNNPIVFGGLRLLNALPISAEGLLSSVLQLNKYS